MHLNCPPRFLDPKLKSHPLFLFYLIHQPVQTTSQIQRLPLSTAIPWSLPPSPSTWTFSSLLMVEFLSCFPPSCLYAVARGQTRSHGSPVESHPRTQPLLLSTSLTLLPSLQPHWPLHASHTSSSFLTPGPHRSSFLCLEHPGLRLQFAWQPLDIQFSVHMSLSSEASLSPSFLSVPALCFNFLKALNVVTNYLVDYFFKSLSPTRLEALQEQGISFPQHLGQPLWHRGAQEIVA